ncbi:YihY/virulence factor BrkB family protein [Chitinophaga pinensis]|uniref:Ribonuclease BN n=1 Tax=Chitinophaga pinensis (strain ATCC 43595 / DSM 2588 / LMG 13176 / NBRC 15968 / NCIMB 11800 / UQM 2034) TaxID=485918 RepID=A0A979H147_CHIPD|nr:YihY/virulence factor BrkB family protein [Chitinophaga pinensis]ACU64040.1 ribonuclease BN [Chitinophaga pinensis DSM 2588]
MTIRSYFTKKSFKDYFTILKAAFTGFMDDMALKFSASLAYYTVFSLAPLLLLLISLAGVFLSRDVIQTKVFSEINGIVGNEAALQVQEMIRNLEMTGKSTISVIIGVVTLIIGATTVFGEIQQSINIIWQVKPKPKKGWLKIIKDRLLSGSMIVTLGFLLLVSLVLNGALDAISDRLKHFLPDVTVTLFTIISYIISFMIISILFGVIFKVLPDAKISWKDVRSGAFFTAVLFMIGRLVIGIYIEKSATSSTYGAAGSLIVIMLWIYYTAAILYFGAEFTRAYADFNGKRIEPADYAVHVEQKEEEKDVAVVPPKHEIGKSD